MEKHKCKLCFRNFSNGRALGGHMRSHMMNLHVPPKPNESLPPTSPRSPPTVQLSFEADSASSPSSSSSEDDKNLSYGLRENPKRSFRLSDPEFADTGSVTLQDRESETESSRNPTRRRSKRSWKLGFLDQQQQFSKKIKFSIHSHKNESLSSVSDTTTEEDVAFCLMMLSRDKWKRQELYDEEGLEEQEEEDGEEEEEKDEEEEESYESEEEMKSSKTTMTTTTTTRVRGKYKCETCNKVLRSYQALGGHRANHKKIKAIAQEQPKLEHHDNKNTISSKNNNDGAKKIHECPVCFRVFASGQALGGHKRTHVIGSSATTKTATAIRTPAPVPNFAKFGGSLIDLNLPAPVDDDEIEDSAVSDAEFVKSR